MGVYVKDVWSVLQIDADTFLLLLRMRYTPEMCDYLLLSGMLHIGHIKSKWSFDLSNRDGNFRNEFLMCYAATNLALQWDLDNHNMDTYPMFGRMYTATGWVDDVRLETADTRSKQRRFHRQMTDSFEIRQSVREELSIGEPAAFCINIRFYHFPQSGSDTLGVSKRPTSTMPDVFDLMNTVLSEQAKNADLTKQLEESKASLNDELERRLGEVERLNGELREELKVRNIELANQRAEIERLNETLQERYRDQSWKKATFERWNQSKK